MRNQPRTDLVISRLRVTINSPLEYRKIFWKCKQMPAYMRRKYGITLERQPLTHYWSWTPKEASTLEVKEQA